MAPHRRQRWWCRPKNGESPHRFTPILPRQVHPIAAPHGFCLECSNGLEAWEGQAGPRRYWFAAREIGDALASVAAGSSYKQAAESARRQADRVRPARPRKPTATRKRRRREAIRDGQLTANWVDAFTDEIACELLPSSWPEIVIIDSMSMRVLDGPRKGKGFHVIAAIGRDRSPGRWSAPLRVVRLAASPTKDADAFEAFCRGLDGIPRVVVTDMDSGTRLGISRAFAAADGSLPEMRMGEWHLKRALRDKLPDALLADPQNRVTQQLATAFISPRKWRDFVAAVRFEHKGPYGPLTGALDFIDRNDAQIKTQAATRSPEVPNSTSPVEAKLSELKVRLKDRAGVFTNRIRMNRLLTLMAIELNGQANGRIWADIVRRRTYTVGGRPPRQRQTDDPKKTSSLTP